MIFWIIWFVSGIVVVLSFVCLAIPRVMLKVHAATLPIRDRAVERSKDENGEVIVYEPSSSVRRFLSSYRITRDREGLAFCGTWARKTAFLQYELVVYNAHNDIIEIIRVKEKFNGEKETHVTRLPKKTDFVSVRVMCADDTPQVYERKRIGARYIVWLTALALCMAAAVDLLLWLIFSFALRLLDRFTSTLHASAQAWGLLLGGGAAAAIVVTVLFALLFLLCTRKRGEETYAR